MKRQLSLSSVSSPPIEKVTKAMETNQLSSSICSSTTERMTSTIEMVTSTIERVTTAIERVTTRIEDIASTIERVTTAMKAKQSTTTISDLPDELLSLILSKLSLEDKLRYERVCKSWQKLSYQHVGKVKLDEGSNKSCANW